MRGADDGGPSCKAVGDLSVTIVGSKSLVMTTFLTTTHHHVEQKAGVQRVDTTGGPRR